MARNIPLFTFPIHSFIYTRNAESPGGRGKCLKGFADVTGFEPATPWWRGQGTDGTFSNPAGGTPFRVFFFTAFVSNG